MRKCSAVLVILVSALAVLAQTPQDDCSAILRGGIFNENTVRENLNFKRAVDDLVFSADFRTHDEAINAGLDATIPIYDVPIVFGGTFSREQRDKFRKEYLSHHREGVSLDTAMTEIRKFADPHLLDVWLKCKEINSRGLSGGVIPVGDRAIYVWVRYAPTDIATTTITNVDGTDGVEVNRKLVGLQIPNAPEGIGAIFHLNQVPATVVIYTSRGNSMALTYNPNVIPGTQTPRSPTAAQALVGEVRAFACNELPMALRQQGWLPCNGQDLERRRYKALFDVIGSSWGTATPPRKDGIAPISFKAPDLRGVFMRGADHGARKDPGGRVASAEHGATGDAVGSYQGDSVGPFPVPLFGGEGQGGSGLLFTALSTNSRSGSARARDGVVDLSKQPETRPKNVAVLFAIFTGVPSDDDGVGSSE